MPERVWSIKYISPITGKRGEYRIPKSDAWNKLSAERYAAVWYAELAASCSKKPERPVPDRSSAPSLRELSSKWLTFREDRLRSSNPKKQISQATLFQNKSNLSCHILKAAFADQPLPAVGHAVLRRFLRDLCVTRSGTTVSNIASTLTSFFDDVMAEEWCELATNPMRHPKVREEIPPIGGTGNSKNVIMLEREMAQRLLTCVEVPVERRVRYLTGLLTGLRDGEIAGLRLERLHLNDAVPWLEVSEALAVHGNTGRFSLKEPKTRAGKRPLPLHPLLSAVLKSWVEEGWAMFVGRKPDAADPVMPRWDGGFHRPCSAAQMRYDLALAGCPTSVDGRDLTFHALRRSFLTWLKDAGVSGEDRRALAGHAARDVEERHYLAVRLPALLEAVTKIALAVDAADVLKRDDTTRRPRRERRGVRTGHSRNGSGESQTVVVSDEHASNPTG